MRSVIGFLCNGFSYVYSRYYKNLFILRDSPLEECVVISFPEKNIQMDRHFPRLLCPNRCYPDLYVSIYHHKVRLLRTE